MKTAVVCSGGLDSVTLAYKVAKEHKNERILTRLISFDYGQRHKKELEFARIHADSLGVPHHIIDISQVGAALTGSALTDNIDVPDGHYTEEQMKSTIVPNRNAIMLTIAYGVASSTGDESVATAVHGGDHFIYPDCRPGFIEKFAAMQDEALEGVSNIKLFTPFVQKTKADIVAEGTKLSVPFQETWSCYKGGKIHCGRCGTCVERREAFDISGIKDPTIYQDSDFWIETVRIEKERQAQCT